MLKKLTVVAGLTLIGLLAGCSASTPEAEARPTEKAPAPTPSEPEAAAAHAFGDTARLEFDGAVWEVTIGKPEPAPASLVDDFPLDEEGTKYVTVSGTVTHIDGPSVEPIEELDIIAVVNSVIVEDEYLGSDEFPSLNAAPELLPGGEAKFTQTFVVAESDEVKTVIATLGVGEASVDATFGEPVDFGEPSADESPDVETMKYAWDQASEDQRKQSLNSWDLDAGQITDKGVSTLISEGEEVGVMLDETEARAFLDWVLTQQ